MKNAIKAILVITGYLALLLGFCNHTTKSKRITWASAEQLFFYSLPPGGLRDEGITVFRNGQPYKEISTNGRHVIVGIDGGDIYSWPQEGENGITVSLYTETDSITKRFEPRKNTTALVLIGGKLLYLSRVR